MPILAGMSETYAIAPLGMIYAKDSANDIPDIHTFIIQIGQHLPVPQISFLG